MKNQKRESIDENNEEDDFKYNENSEELNVIDIFNKIAPYLSNPDKILQFLKKNSSVPKEDLIEIIENEIKTSNTIIRTDLRILLNSL